MKPVHLLACIGYKVTSIVGRHTKTKRFFVMIKASTWMNHIGYSVYEEIFSTIWTLSQCALKSCIPTQAGEQFTVAESTTCSVLEALQNLTPVLMRYKMFCRWAQKIRMTTAGFLITTMLLCTRHLTLQTMEKPATCVKLIGSKNFRTLVSMRMWAYVWHGTWK